MERIAGFQKQKSQKEQMALLGIKESQLVERFIRAQGPGGQKLNKTSSCVYLKHSPSGLEVKCQKTRSQTLNRFYARRILIEKIQSIILKQQTQEQERIAKIKKQKRKRSKKTREKLRKVKEIRAVKKKLRSNKIELE
ncbi:MAG: peptide chain release factor-like protein [Candidatus Omnitrophota bacterium]